MTDLLELILAQLAVADEDSDRGHLVGVGELTEHVLNLGGVGGLRKEGRLVIGGHLGDTAEVGSPDPRSAHPYQDEHGGQEDTQPPGRSAHSRCRGLRVFRDLLDPR